MTIVATTTVTVYALAGSNLGPFNTVWPFEQADDVHVFLYTPTAEPLELASPLGFTLTAPDPDVSGGSVMLEAASFNGSGAWLAGAMLVLQRQTSEDQPTALADTGQFLPSVYMAALDHLGRQIQDVDTTLTRTLQVPLGETGFTLPPAAERAGFILSFDPATGAPVFTLAVTTIGGMNTLVGPKGDKGDQGIQGIQGIPGAGSLGFTPLNKAGDTATNLTLVKGNLDPLAAGFLGGPVNEQDGAYVLVAADGGCIIQSNAGGATAKTIPPNSGVAFPVGAMVGFYNAGAGAVTITPGAGVTLTWAGAGTAGARILAQFGFCIIWQRAANVWAIVGVGLT